MWSWWRSSIESCWKKNAGGSGHAHEPGLELHGPDAIDLEVYVVVAFNAADVASFGAHPLTMVIN
jgi:hypothetical protein